jgi:uncharacterized membrane protein (DUF2068 family)
MVILAVANIAFIAIPGASDDVPMLALIGGLILGIVALPASVGLWRCRRWGMIATVVISALNFITSIPGIALGPSAFAIVSSAILSVVSVVTIILALMRDARASYV